MAEAYSPWHDLATRYPHVHVEHCDTRPARGVWVPDFDVILIDWRLSRHERRCSLAHEICHMDLGHARTGHHHFDRLQEGEADQLAARRLIPLDGRLADVLRWSTAPEEIAAELEVTVDVLRTRMDHLHPAERAHLARALNREDVPA